MADHGFTTEESVIYKHGTRAPTAFTRNQLDPIDVEKTRNVRSHVERIIGLLHRKYTIYDGTPPLDLPQRNLKGLTDVRVPGEDNWPST